jgi:hypothetical protein
VGTEDERRLLAEWVAACVERVLPVFEGRRAYDPRPRMAVDAARTFAQGMIGEGAARQAALAAHAAARATVDPAARAAARAAGHAAATAHMGGHARHAAEYAVKAAGAGDPSAGERERAWQYDHAPEDVRRWVFPEGAPG